MNLDSELPDMEGHVFGAIIKNIALVLDTLLAKEEVRRRTRILVAKDNMVNQKQLIRNRERLTDKRLPIIALTAHALAGDTVHFLAGGIDDYVAKPLKIDALVSAIDRQLGKQQVV
jgi:DNA-binding response OmpR family regulator